MPSDSGFDHARHIADTDRDNQRSAKRMGAIAGALGATSIVAVAAISGMGPSPDTNATQVHEVGIQSNELRVDVNNQIVMASKPDRVVIGTLVIDWSKMPADHGARRGSFINDENNVQKAHIKKINGLSVDTNSDITTIENVTEVIGEGNVRNTDLSPYAQVLIETDLDSHPVILDITTTDNTFPAVYFKPHSHVVDVEKVTKEGVVTKNPTASLALSELNKTTIIPSQGHPIALPTIP